MNRLKQSLIQILAAMALAMCQCAAAESWPLSDDPNVQSESYCGKVVAITGTAAVRRSYMSDKEQSVALSEQDRLYAGDEVLVGNDSKVEWVFGSNILCLAGPGARFKSMGQRRFPDEADNQMSRLDLRLFEGQFRFQVRLNTEHPESLYVRLREAEFLVTRGDLSLNADRDWRAVTLAGPVLYRTSRGGVSTELPAGQAIAANGVEKVLQDAARDMRNKFPFSFEEYRNALPPRPPPNPEDEAP